MEQPEAFSEQAESSPEQTEGSSEQAGCSKEQNERSEETEPNPEQCSSERTERSEPTSVEPECSKSESSAEQTAPAEPTKDAEELKWGSEPWLERFAEALSLVPPLWRAGHMANCKPKTKRGFAYLRLVAAMDPRPEGDTQERVNRGVDMCKEFFKQLRQKTREMSAGRLGAGPEEALRRCPRWLRRADRFLHHVPLVFAQLSRHTDKHSKRPPPPPPVLASAAGAALMRRVVRGVRRAARDHGGPTRVAAAAVATRIGDTEERVFALWSGMRKLAMFKLRALLARGDAPSDSGRLDALDWAIVDLLISYGISLVGETSYQHYDQLSALLGTFHLVQRFQLEKPGQMVQPSKWSEAARWYSRNRVQMSALGLQRRWWELKMDTRRRFLARMRRGPAAPEPLPLHQAIARRYQHVVLSKCRPVPWKRLVTEGRVAAPTSERGPSPGEPDAVRTRGHDETSDSDTAPAEGDDDDLTIVENTLETIDLSEDKSDEATTSEVVSKAPDQIPETQVRKSSTPLETDSSKDGPSSKNRTEKTSKNTKACSKLDKTIDVNKEIVDVDAPIPKLDVLEVLKNLDVSDIHTTIFFDSDEDDIKCIDNVESVDKAGSGNEAKVASAIKEVNENESHNDKNNRNRRDSSDSEDGNLVIDCEDSSSGDVRNTDSVWRDIEEEMLPEPLNKWPAVSSFSKNAVQKPDGNKTNTVNVTDLNKTDKYPLLTNMLKSKSILKERLIRKSKEVGIFPISQYSSDRDIRNIDADNNLKVYHNTKRDAKGRKQIGKKNNVISVGEKIFQHHSRKNQIDVRELVNAARIAEYAQNIASETGRSGEDESSSSGESGGGEENEEGVIDPKLLMYAVVLLRRMEDEQPHIFSHHSTPSPLQIDQQPSDSPSPLQIDQQPSDPPSPLPLQIDQQPSDPPSPLQIDQRPSDPPSPLQIDQQPSDPPSPLPLQIDQQPSDSPSPLQIDQQPSDPPSPLQIDQQPSDSPSPLQIDQQPSDSPSPLQIDQQPSDSPSPLQIDQQPSDPPSPLQIDQQPCDLYQSLPMRLSSESPPSSPPWLQSPPLNYKIPPKHPHSLFHYYAATLSPKIVYLKRNIPLLKQCKPCSVVLTRMELGEKRVNRVAKKVELPDIEEVRRNNRSMLTAQVAPLAPIREGDVSSPEPPSCSSDSDWSPGAEPRPPAASRAADSSGDESDGGPRRHPTSAELGQLLNDLLPDNNGHCNHDTSTGLRGPMSSVWAESCASCAVRVLSAPPASGGEARLQRRLLRRLARASTQPSTTGDTTATSTTVTTTTSTIGSTTVPSMTVAKAAERRDKPKKSKSAPKKRPRSPSPLPRPRPRPRSPVDPEEAAREWLRQKNIAAEKFGVKPRSFKRLAPAVQPHEQPATILPLEPVTSQVQKPPQNPHQRQEDFQIAMRDGITSVISLSEEIASRTAQPVYKITSAHSLINQTNTQVSNPILLNQGAPPTLLNQNPTKTNSAQPSVTLNQKKAPTLLNQTTLNQNPPSIFNPNAVADIKKKLVTLTPNTEPELSFRPIITNVHSLAKPKPAYKIATVPTIKTIDPVCVKTAKKDPLTKNFVIIPAQNPQTGAPSLLIRPQSQDSEASDVFAPETPMPQVVNVTGGVHLPSTSVGQGLHLIVSQQAQTNNTQLLTNVLNQPNIVVNGNLIQNVQNQQVNVQSGLQTNFIYPSMPQSVGSQPLLVSCQSMTATMSQPVFSSMPGRATQATPLLVRSVQSGPCTVTQLNAIQQVSQQNVLQQNVIQQNVIQQNVIQQNMIQQNVTQQNVLQLKMPQQNVPQQNLSLLHVSPHNVSQQTAFQQNVTQQNVPQQNMLQLKIPQQNVSQQNLSLLHVSPHNVSQQTAFQHNVTQQNVPQQNVLQLKIPQQNVSQQNLSLLNVLPVLQQNVPQQNALQQSVSLQHALPQSVLQPNVSRQNVSQQNVTQQNVLHQNVPHQNVLQQSVSQQNVTQQNVPHQNVLQQSVSQQNVSQQNVTQQNVSHQNVSRQNVSQQNVSQQNDVTQQKAASLPTNPEEPNDSETSDDEDKNSGPSPTESLGERLSIMHLKRSGVPSHVWAKGRDSTRLSVLCTAADRAAWELAGFLLVAEEEPPPRRPVYCALRPLTRLLLPGEESPTPAKQPKLGPGDSSKTWLKVKAFARLAPEAEAPKDTLEAPPRVFVNSTVYQKLSDDPLLYAKLLVAVPHARACRALLARGASLQLYCLRTGKLFPLQAEPKDDVSRITLSGDEDVSCALVSLAKQLYNLSDTESESPEPDTERQTRKAGIKSTVEQTPDYIHEYESTESDSTEPESTESESTESESTEPRSTRLGSKRPLDTGSTTRSAERRIAPNPSPLRKQSRPTPAEVIELSDED